MKGHGVWRNGPWSSLPSRDTRISEKANWFSRQGISAGHPVQGRFSGQEPSKPDDSTGAGPGAHRLVQLLFAAVRTITLVVYSF